MSDVITISLKKEQELGEDFVPIGKVRNAVYINCGDIWARIGYANTREEVLNLIAPEKISDVLDGFLNSEVSFQIISALRETSKYYFYDEEFVYKETFRI